MKDSLKFFCIFALVLFPMVVQSQDAFKLGSFYNSTGGPSWDNANDWLDDDDPCDPDEWFGVNCISTFWRLELPGNNLNGTIPPEFYGYDQTLQFLDLEDNPELGGTLSTDIDDFAFLGRLELSGTGLSGTIPTELGNLTSLTVLDLSFTGFRGPIPTEFGQLEDLILLDLSYIPDLNGTLPSEINRLGELTFLDISGNTNMDGPFPLINGSGLFLTAQDLGFFGEFPQFICAILGFNFSGTSFDCPAGLPSCCDNFTCGSCIPTPSPSPFPVPSPTPSPFPTPSTTPTPTPVPVPIAVPTPTPVPVFSPFPVIPSPAAASGLSVSSLCLAVTAIFWLLF